MFLCIFCSRFYFEYFGLGFIMFLNNVMKIEFIYFYFCFIFNYFIFLGKLNYYLK